MKRFLIGGLALAAVSSSFGQVIDGTRDASYNGGNFQTVDTNFGDSNQGSIYQANGSELAGMYAEITSTHLVLMFTGNLQTNFNKFELFIDVDGATSGQNVLRNDNANVDFNGLNRMAGLTFDSGFNADYYLTLTAGNASASAGEMFANFATLPTAGAGVGTYLGTSNVFGAATTLTGGSNLGIQLAINNSNTGGVAGGTGAANLANAQAASTGIEISIPLSEIGNPTWGGGLRVSSFINGSGHDFVSNQVLGGLPGSTGNLGEPANVNFNNIAGNQFVAVPEPASMAVLGLGILGLARRRRNK